MDTLIAKAEAFVTEYLNTNLDNTFVYHNIAHTQRVVDNLKTLFEEVELTEDEKSQLLISAWFHDTGFTKNIENHETESKAIAISFLQKENVSEDFIASVSSIISATKMEHQPKNILEGLIKDADCAHIASKNCFLFY